MLGVLPFFFMEDLYKFLCLVFCIGILQSLLSEIKTERENDFPPRGWFWVHCGRKALGLLTSHRQWWRRENWNAFPGVILNFFFQVCNTLYMTSKQTIKSIYIIHPHSGILGPGNDATDRLFYKLLVTKIKQKHFGTCSFKKCSASHSSDQYTKTRFQLVQPV